MSEAGSEPGRGVARPLNNAMLICDMAIREEQTRKITLVGIFNRITGAAFPLVHGRPTCVYARVTDAAGRYKIKLELVRLDDEQALGRLESDVDFRDRLTAHELIFGLDGLRFERPGAHEFRLFANDAYVAGAALEVRQTSAERQEEPNG